MPAAYAAAEVSKSFGAVRALRDVDLAVDRGTIHGLVGANGAGKSTRVKILAGALLPDAGTLTLAGEVVSPSSMAAANELGIALVSQEISLFPDLTVRENLYLLETGHGWESVEARGREVLLDLGFHASLDVRVGDLDLADQQIVEIARAMLQDPDVLILDEPTSSLEHAEKERLARTLRALRERDAAILYVSHFLEEVLSLADTITILRDGERVAEERPGAVTLKRVVSQMCGEQMLDPLRGAERGDNAPEDRGRHLVLSGLCGRRLAGASLEATEGRVLGLAGLQGSGAAEALRAVFGAVDYEGSITLPDGSPGPRSMTEAVRKRIAFVPADRKDVGLMLTQTIDENVAHVHDLGQRRGGLFIRPRARRARAEDRCRELGVRMRDVGQPVSDLSGGNQQKVVFAKWMEAEPDVVLLDDPTRGVDVGAKAEIHRLIRDMADDDRTILLMSSDLRELSSVCDEIAVFFEGRVIGVLSREQASQRVLTEAINGGSLEEALSAAGPDVHAHARQREDRP